MNHVPCSRAVFVSVVVLSYQVIVFWRTDWSAVCPSFQTRKAASSRDAAGGVGGGSDEEAEQFAVLRLVVENAGEILVLPGGCLDHVRQVLRYREIHRNLVGLECGPYNEQQNAAGDRASCRGCRCGRDLGLSEHGGREFPCGGALGDDPGEDRGVGRHVSGETAKKARRDPTDREDRDATKGGRYRNPVPDVRVILSRRAACRAAHQVLGRQDRSPRLECVI
jgi:hypothetical protein